MKICIITPSLNQGRYVERCVRSVMAQLPMDADLEYVVMDGNSSDETPEILHRLRDEFPALRSHIQEDAGQADALARGFRSTDADVLGWLNADDILLPGSLERVANVFRSTDADVVYGNAWFINEQDALIGAYPCAAFNRDYLRKFCFISQPSTFFRRSAYEAVGGIDVGLRYCMDYGLWLRFSEAGRAFKQTKAYLSATRLHGDTKTARGGMDFVDEVFGMLARETGEVPLEWFVYRRYRRTLLEARGVSEPRAFLQAALAEAISSGHAARISAWVLRVIRDHVRATVAAQSGILDARRRGAPPPLAA